MNVTCPIAGKILRRLSRRQGEAVPVRDFLDLGTRAAVAQALSCLVRQAQVPAKITYHTNGRTRSITLGPYSVKLLNRGPKTMDVKGQTAPLVFQTLQHLGQKGAAPKAIGYLRSKLSRKERAELKRSLRYAAAWMKPIIEQIAREENG